MAFLRSLCLFLAALLLAPTASAADRGPLVLAAASLQESLTEAADAWAAQGHARPVLSFAASSALARQIMAGAPADLFISADEPWMDAVAKAGLLRPGTRANLVGNRLVLRALRRRTGLRVHDIAPLRAARREALLGLGVEDRRSGYPVELLDRAARAGWRVHEVDVDYHPRTAGTRSKVSGSVRGSLRAAYDFWRVLA